MQWKSVKGSTERQWESVKHRRKGSGRRLDHTVGPTPAVDGVVVLVVRQQVGPACGPHRRCYSADTPSPSLLKRLLNREWGCSRTAVPAVAKPPPFESNQRCGSS